jgi:hypothetical protein
MRLDESATYVVIGTTPPDHRQMKVGDMIGLRLCEPGGPEFRLSLRLTQLSDDGTFRGVTNTPDRTHAQRVGGSFTNPTPDLSTR